MTVNPDGSIGAADSGGSVACGTNTTIDSLEISAPSVNFGLYAPLGPGVTTEPTGVPEIETRVAASGAVALQDGVGAGQAWHAGQLAIGRGVNLNVDDDADDFVVTTPNTILQLAGRLGDDVITLDGTNAGGTPVASLLTAVFGGPGADQLTGPGYLIGGADDDTLTSAGGGVVIQSETASGALRMRSDLSGTETGADGDGGTDTYVDFAQGVVHSLGTPLGDVLHGGPSADTSQGFGGDDMQFGHGGADVMTGGAGVDSLDGGAGNDRLSFGTDGQIEAAGAGGTAVGGAGSDTIYGSDGPDTITARDGEQDRVLCAGETDTGSIDRVDDASACEMPVATATIADANAGESGNLTFTLSLSHAVEFQTTVQVELSDGSASSPADYDGNTLIATFPANTTTTSVTVPVVSDSVDEPDETFSASLANPSSAIAASSASAIGTIVDDDVAPDLAVSKSGPASVIPGHDVSYTLTVTNHGHDAATGVVLSDAAPSGLTFSSVTQSSGPPANCTVTSTRLECAVGTMAVSETRTFSLTGRVGTDAEAGGTLTNTATIDGSQADRASANDASSTSAEVEPVATVSIQDTSGSESAALDFTVSLDAPVGFDTSVTVEPTAGTTSSGDFDSTPVHVTIAAGQTSATARIRLTDDDSFEPDETLEATITAASPALATGDGAATGTIADDDPPPAPTLSAPSQVPAPGPVDVTEGGLVAGATLECSLRPRGAAPPDFAACPAGLVFNGLAAGTYVLAVRQVAAGRRSAPAEVTFRVVTVDLPLSCTRLPVVVVDVSRASRSRVRVSGLADPRRFVGRTVEILVPGRVLARTTVASDGTFSVARRPGRAKRFAARIASGGPRSRFLRLDRRLAIVRRTRHNGGARVTFRVDAPRPPRWAVVTRRTGCTERMTVARVRLNRRSGRGTVTLARPTGDDPLALYRVVASLHGGQTFSLPIAVRPARR